MSCQTLSRNQYLAFTEGATNPYNICVSMGQYEALCSKADDMNLLLATAEAEKRELLQNLAAMRQLIGDTKTKTKKPKAVPKYVSEAGANAKAQRRLQEAGKLEPFREGGCRCRTWGNGLGKQCNAKAGTDGFCKTHYRKVVQEGNGLWTMGFYDQPRPNTWGEVDELSGLCHPVPGDRKKDTTIPWKMEQEAFDKAFADLNQLDRAGNVELELKDHIQTSSDDDDASVSSDASTLVLSSSDEEVVEVVEEAPKVICFQCEGEGKRIPACGQWTNPQGVVEDLCQECLDYENADESDGEASDNEE